MNTLAIVLIAAVCLAAAYLLYGRWLANKWGIDPAAKTPAQAHEDGQDYVPTKGFTVFCHQFSSIAGAGPVTGAIQAAAFGWLPVLLWVLLGGIFFGAVTDFGALYASVKNDGKSIGLLIEKYIGKLGRKLFLLFCWLFTLLVIAAFADMVAGTFNAFTTVDGQVQLSEAARPNGAAGTISLLFILFAMVFGVLQKKFNLSGWKATVVGLVCTIAALAIGMALPITAGKDTWTYITFVYIFFAAAETTESTVDAQTEGADAQTEAGRQFVVGFDAEFPPYGYKDDSGEYVGFDLDLAQEVCNRLGWTLVKQPIDWDAKDMELDSGAIDCIWNGFTMNGREDQYTFSVPYVDNSQVFVVAEDSGITSKEDLAGKVVGVQKDSSALAALQGDEKALADTFADLPQYADYNTGFMDLEAGAIDALALDIGVANYQIASRGSGYVVLDEYLSTEQYGIGFKKGNDELKDTVEKTLLEMADDGTFMEIAEKYADYGLVDSVCLGK